MATTYEIYPAIGIARVGSSPEYYLGQESPQLDYLPAGGNYRDNNQLLKRMGGRFRIYEMVDGVAVREITAAEASIEWEVHIANTKASRNGMNSGVPRNELVIDPGAKTLLGANQSADLTGSIQGISVSLGNLETDADGRLIVIGSADNSASWKTPKPARLNGLYNDQWYDNAGDGPVKARITLNGTATPVDCLPAWVISSIPDYAHAQEGIVTLYDLVAEASGAATPSTVSFTRDIYPVLRRTSFMQWTSQTADTGHGEGRNFDFLDPQLFPSLWDKNLPGSAALRRQIFDALKIPSEPQNELIGAGGSMPKLNGLAVTPIQYENFRRWADGNYDADWTGTPAEPSLSDLPVAEQPEALTRASLGACVGGSFSPGLEAGNTIAQSSIYNSPFRLNTGLVPPGYLTHVLSIPWQADFLACGTGWWPSGRPVDVYEPGAPNKSNWTRNIQKAEEMVEQWANLGFIVKESGTNRYVEVERTVPSGGGRGGPGGGPRN